MLSKLQTTGCLKNRSDCDWLITYDEKTCPETLLNKVKSALKGDVPGDWVALRGSMFSRVWRAVIESKVYVVKEFLLRSPLDQLKAIFRGTRAERAWSHGKKLIEKGFLTPDVIACGKESAWIFTKRQFIITEFIPDVVGGYETIRLINDLPFKKRIEARRALMKGLGNTIAKLHRAGIIHGDLRPNNILISGWRDNKPMFYFIDNERNSFHSIPPHRLIVKNLVQLNMVLNSMIRNTDRMRFFKAYIDAFPEMADKKNNIAKEVRNRTEQRMAKHGGL